MGNLIVNGAYAAPGTGVGLASVMSSTHFQQKEASQGNEEKLTNKSV